LDAGDCPLPVVKHGYVFGDIYGTADMTSHGQEIYYTCEAGYVNGTDAPRCNNGTWTADAFCTPGSINQCESTSQTLPLTVAKVVIS